MPQKKSLFFSFFPPFLGFLVQDIILIKSGYQFSLPATKFFNQQYLRDGHVYRN